MAEVYGDTPTNQRLVTRETEVALFATLLAALADLINRIPGLALPYIAGGANHWGTGPMRDRFDLHITGIPDQLTWARAIGATEVIVRRGEDSPEDGGRGYVHLHYLGTVSGIPVCVWGAAHGLEPLSWSSNMVIPLAVLEAGLARSEAPPHIAFGEAVADYHATLTPADPS